MTVEVTQADRDAAADALHRAKYIGSDMRVMIEAGGGDDNHPVVQAFAQHRCSALGGVAGLVEALEAIQTGTANAHEFFKTRLGGRKYPTWHAVNVLQDHLEAAKGTATAALATFRDQGGR